MEAIGSLPIDKCVRMLPPARMKGIWIDAFEGSQFLPGLTHPRSRYSGPRIWLDTGRVHLKHGYEAGRRNGRAVLIDFVGRRTPFPGATGHLGLFDYEIIVDRLISARELR